MEISKFKVGEEIYYYKLNAQDNTVMVDKGVIQGIDMVDSIPRIWINNDFGYYYERNLFRTLEEAEEYAKRRGIEIGEEFID